MLLSSFLLEFIVTVHIYVYYALLVYSLLLLLNISFFTSFSVFNFTALTYLVIIISIIIFLFWGIELSYINSLHYNLGKILNFLVYS